MKVKDLVSFSKESFFNGAVQTEWFYDPEKIKAISESYVFHGPKYYGVSGADVKAGEHKLIDTASFAKIITDKLYSTNTNSSFLMTIAGYGSGKSHLAVCLGALFSGDEKSKEKIIQNIAAADKEIGEYIARKIGKKNFVIVLNGMNNFNLDAEVLRCVRLSLAKNGLSDDCLRKLTKSYDVSKHFVDKTFKIYSHLFEKAAEIYDVADKGETLKQYLLNHVEDENKAVEIINRVFLEVNGDRITWDRGLAAGDILATIQEELCGEGKPFNKILLLFDEFGRYIEYTAANPAIAGEAALQQIFEAAQSADGKIVFVGYIQSELDAYLARIEKTSNITRYLERYRTASENLFLSSNFETILANFLKKKEGFAVTVKPSLLHYEHYYKKIKSALTRWDRSSIKKMVWVSDKLYSNVIMEGCYPLHPVTVWLLSNSHQWMQQRSTLAFASEMFDTISSTEVDRSFLPYIYPYQIVDSGIFNEMLNSEEKGLVPSQYCMLYRDIIVKVGDKLTAQEKTTLKAILVMNMGRMAFYDKEDAIYAICVCSNLQGDEVKDSLKSLEEMHGVVAYDDNARTYDLIAEASGFNEFKRAFFRYSIRTTATINDMDEDVMSQLSLNSVLDTPFGQEHHISSTEWGFNRWVIDSRNIDKEYLLKAIRTTTMNCNGDNARGVLIYAYCHHLASSEIQRLSSIYRVLELDRYPIIILFLDDPEGDILKALSVKNALKKFSVADRERFRKHIANQERGQNTKIISMFTSCVTKRIMIGNQGLVNYKGRLNVLCTNRFENLFTKPVPFPFDGFENKSKVQAQSTLITLCMGLFNHTLMNVQVYNALPPKDKNRTVAVLSTKSPYSWRVFNDNCQLVEPQNEIVKEIFDQCVEKLNDEKRCTAYELLNTYMQAPYGMNENSLSLFLMYFLAFGGKRYLHFCDERRLKVEDWNDKKGKIKIPELVHISVQKNPNFEVDEIATICHQILDNTDVKKCEQLELILNNVLEEDGEDEKNKYLIARAHTYLEEGLQLSKSNGDLLKEIKGIICDAKVKLTIPKFIKVFKLIPDFSDGLIKEGLGYTYSDDFKKEVSSCKNDINEVMKSQYTLALHKMKCQVTELVWFEKNMHVIIKTLHQYGFIDYANQTAQYVQSVKDEVLAKQKYEKAIVDCNRDIAMSKTVSEYEQIILMQPKLESWIEFLGSANDLPTSVSQPLVEKLNDSVNKLGERKLSILQDYQNVVDAVKLASNLVEIKKVNSKLEKLSELHLDDKYQQEIVVLKEAIVEAMKYIDELPDDIEALDDTISRANYRTLYCGRAVKGAAEQKKMQLTKAQETWVIRNLEPVMDGYTTMSTQECLHWIKKAETVPQYFDTKTMRMLEKANELVQSRLHESRVEGLISMYDQLTDVEQKEFINRITAR